MINLDISAPLFWEAVRSAAAALSRFEFSIAGINFNADRKSQDDIIEYLVSWPSGSIPVSLQFYKNERDHWRLFGFTPPRSSMLFSVNLSTPLSEAYYRIPLQQTIKITGPQERSRIERRLAADKCVDLLGLEGFDVEGNVIILGQFDFSEGKFVTTDDVQFLKDFIKVSIIKGHFMANKGYRIEGLA